MKYTLIYTFYIDNSIDSFNDNPIYDLHIKCLTAFHNTWDRIIFILSVDDLTNKLINEVKVTLSTIFYDKDISFIIEKNNSLYREGIHFYNYIVNKLDTFDDNEYVMFAHSKGVFNFTDGKYPYIWVSSMYYLNCFNRNNIQTRLNNNSPYYVYGGLMLSKYHTLFMKTYCFAGSFYWINPKKIVKYIKENNIDLSIESINNLCGIRSIAEYFPNILFDESKIDYYCKDYIKDDYILNIRTSCLDIYNNDSMKLLLKFYLFYNDYLNYENFLDKYILYDI